MTPRIESRAAPQQAPDETLLHRCAFPGLMLALLLAATHAAFANSVPNTVAEPRPEPAFIGTARCAGCHQDQYQAWQNSHHDLAMQKPTPETVLGDFNNRRFEHLGSITEFQKDNGSYYVITEGPDGKPERFEVAWVFGVYPLQQYLLPLADGRLQALSVAWDSRPADDGGQRWYHLYPDEAIAHDDPLHWTGPYQNWNTRCAECHSTDVHKNYDVTTRRFDTAFFEEDVGCEGCHGPGSQHLKLAQTARVAEQAGGGFPVDLAARGEWAFPTEASIARRRDPYPGNAQIDTCGRCHARRGSLGAYHYGRPLSDTHRLSLLGDPLYYPDGQILDEVYVYGSFVQSKMHQAGVVCSNCHEPHSNELRAPGSDVCNQCHKAAIYAAQEHHGHPEQSSGSECLSCHMPATTYMGVDARRDHSMRIPRPDLSVMTGAPNACTMCHTDRSDDWAIDALRKRGVVFRDTARHPAVAMNQVARGDARGVPRLLQLAEDAQTAPIWRATALERSAGLGSREALRLAVDFLGAEEPLLRVSGVRALAALPPDQRFRYLAPVATDPVSGVRLEAAQQLADVPLERLRPVDRQRLVALFDEFRGVHREHADMPSMNLQVGVFHQTRGDLPAAEAAYREALLLNPQHVGASLNLADLLRVAGRDAEARGTLEAALVTAPGNADATHALGLLEIRAGDQERALELLALAAEATDASPRHTYVYAIALHDTGNTGKAIEVLRLLHRRLPADQDALLALSNYSAEIGERAAASGYAETLLRLAPENPRYRRLAASLAR